MELVPGEGYRFLLLVGEFDFNGVKVGVEFAANGQACGGRGVGDEVDDGLVSFEWPSAPVVGDSRKEPMFNLVPFTGSGWVVADGDVESGFLGQSGEFEFPQPGAVSVGSATVGGDEDPAGVGVLFPADSTPTPRFRLGRHRRTTIPLIQPGQQIRQACPHRLELVVILGGHNVNNFTG